MPIFESRCLECNEVFELLFVTSDDRQEMKCKNCGSRELERILSTTNFSVSSSLSGASGPTTYQRTCSIGSCTTIEIPSHGD